MIDYNNKRRFYTPGGEFSTLAGGNYVGYVTCLSGQAYADTSSIPLLPESSFESNFHVSPYLKNRDIFETLTLPYNSEDILFQANDFLTKELFLDRLGKLHDNNTYVYSKMFMADNDLPVFGEAGAKVINYSYACLPESNSTSLEVVAGTVQSVPFSTSNRDSFRQLGNVRRFVSKLKDENSKEYTIFAITSSGVTTLIGSNTKCNVIESHSVYIESTENELKFGSLFDISLSKNFVFITDEKNSVIYKYDIAGYYNGDIALANKRNLIEILGGDGPQDAKNLFKNPKHITSSDDVIVINDSGNNLLKVYDLDFNFITRIGSMPLSVEPVVALKINEFFNTLYVFTKSRDTDENRLNLYILDLNCFNILETYKNLDIPLQRTEEVVNVEFSKNNSDYYYVCTNRQIYKLFVSKPGVLIGRYQELRLDYVSGPTPETPGDRPRDTITEEVITPSNQWYIVKKFFKDSKWNWSGKEPPYTVTTTPGGRPPNFTPPPVGPITLFEDVYKGINFLPTTKDYDTVVLLTNGRVFFFDEPNIYKQVIKSTSIYKFGKTNMTLSSEEYIQASTINKELYKVARDILTLKNNLVGRFTGEYDSNNIFRLTDYNYNIDFNSFNLFEPEDYYVHENEKSMVSVINRALTNIIDLQEKLINLTSVDRLQTVKKELVITSNAGTLQIS